MDEKERLLETLIGLTDENEVVEFKEARNEFSKDKLGEYFSGLSNEANLHGKDSAWLVFGISDKSHAVVGTNFIDSQAKQNEIMRFIGEQTSPSMSFTEIISMKKNGKRVMLFRIPAAPQGMPVAFKRLYYGRDGESLVGLSIDKIKRISSQVAEDWSKGIIADASIDDLDLDAVAKARKLFAERNPHKASEIESWDTITFLNKAKLALKGKITRTALLLLGKNECEYMLSPADPKIRWILRDEKGLVKSHCICGIPFLLSVDIIYNKIRNLTYQYMKSGTLFPEEVLQYEPFTIREALYNCIAHQTYTNGRRIDVIEREEDLTFINGGSFMPGNVEKVVIENAPEGIYRNQFLVTAMTNLKMVETAGGGIRKMFDIQRSKFFPLPEYVLSDNEVKVVITGRVVDKTFAEILSKNPDLSIEDVILLDKVSKRKKLTNEEISYLRNKKLVEGRKPNIYLAKSVASAIDRKAEYSKMKGLKNEGYRQLILEALNTHEKLTRAELERLLSDILPSNLGYQQKKNRIDTLLRYLRKNGKITYHKTDSGSYWTIAK